MDETIDLSNISEEHRVEILNLLNKYEEEDKKNWIENKYSIEPSSPQMDKIKSSTARKAITEFAKELYKRLYDIWPYDNGKSTAEDYMDTVKEMGVNIDD